MTSIAERLGLSRGNSRCKKNVDAQSSYRTTVCDALHKYKRKHGYTGQFIYEEIGVHRRTVNGWIAHKQAPQGANFFALVDLFGVSFLNDILRVFGYAGAYRITGSPGCPNALLSDLLEKAAFLSRALEDGKLDHMERAELRPLALKLLTSISAFLAEEEGQS